MPVVGMKLKGCLPHDVTDLKYRVFHEIYDGRKKTQKAQNGKIGEWLKP